MSTLVRVKNLKRYRDRHGKWRCYHRPTGRPIAAEFGSEAFFAELRALNGLVEEKQAAARGTLKAVMDEYKRSPAFADLAMATRTGYEKYFAIAKPLHDVPIRAIDSAALAIMRDKLAMKRGKRTSGWVLSVLSVVFSFAVERRYASANPVKAVKRVRVDRGAPRANRPWTLEERREVLARAPIQLRVPIALCMFTGLRKGDVLRMPKRTLTAAGELVLATRKTGEDLVLTVHPDLAAIVRAAPHHDAPTLAATTRGQSWTSSGFDSMWDRFKRGLERERLIGPNLTVHGLRHTVGALLAEGGADPDTIRRVLAQRTLHMALLYSDRAKKDAATRKASGQLDPLGNGSAAGATEGDLDDGLSTPPEKNV